jgi:hypothetical protein
MRSMTKEGSRAKRDGLRRFDVASRLASLDSPDPQANAKHSSATFADAKATFPQGGRARAYPTISPPGKNCAISIAAVSGASEPCTEFSPIDSANSLRIVPGAAFSGLVAPITSR